MIIYIIKSTLCSGFFLLFHFLFLEREKMYRFNRFYLLLSIAVSGIIPFITFEATETLKNIPQVEKMMYYNFQPLETVEEPITTTNFLIDWPNFLFISYLSISLFLLARFVANLIKIYKVIHSSELGVHKNVTLVFLHQVSIPFSFLNFIFLKKEAFENGKIEEEILEHELSHVAQKHTIDILIMELLIIFCWINPILFLYKKAIQLNHEFLADEGVINLFKNVSGYQKLLLNKSFVAQELDFTSSFNYFITKKRLIMMTKSTSKSVVFLKKVAVIPFLALCIYFFSEKADAQSKPISGKSTIKEVSASENGVTKELLDEYKSIVSLINFEAKWNPKKAFAKFTEKDKKRLEAIYLQMNKQQQKEQKVYFIEKLPPMEKHMPTKVDYEKWKNKNMYGVWLDGNRIKNVELNKYKNTDFSLVFVSYLHKNARSFGPHHYQVDLETHKYYENYVRNELADPSKLMLVRNFKEK